MAQDYDEVRPEVAEASEATLKALRQMDARNPRQRARRSARQTHPPGRLPAEITDAMRKHLLENTIV